MFGVRTKSMTLKHCLRLPVVTSSVDDAAYSTFNHSIIQK